MGLCNVRLLGMTSFADVVTSAEACEALHVDRSTLTRWVAAGKITPLTKLPGSTGAFLFDPSEVERIQTGRAA